MTFYQDQLATIYCGDALEVLKELPDQSIQMVMTSPPYWGLRQYAGGADIVWPDGWRGQLGLEPTPDLYVEHLMMIFQEVKRVLRKDGSFYLNIGDTYAGSGAGYSSPPDPKWPKARTGLLEPRRLKTIPPKCMTCIPEQVMFAILGAGWTLRNKIIWHKPNTMPSSVKDRFTTTWEYLYFFTKARKYYFDLDSVREPHTAESLERYQSGDDLFGHGPNQQSFNLRVRDVKRGKGGVFVQGGEVRELMASEQEVEAYEYPEQVPRYHGSGPQYKLSGLERGNKHHGSSMDNQDRLHKDRQTGDTPDYNSKFFHGDYGQNLQGFQRDQTIAGERQASRVEAERLYPNDPTKQQEYINFVHDHSGHPQGKNPGDIIGVTTVRHKAWMSTPGHPFTHRATGEPQNPSDYWELTTQPYKGAHFAVFPEKLCERPIKASSRVGDTILDPFGGSGTTGVVAKRLGRKSIIIDCVERYCEIAKRRIQKVAYQPALL